MPALREHLSNLPYHDLRAVATRLGLRERNQNRKAHWLEGILEAWREEAARAQILAHFSPAATAAANRLSAAGEMPGALFLAEYGPIRRAGPGRHWSPPPWESPQNVSEELYYAGALCPTSPAPIERAARLALPLELQPYLAGPIVTSAPAEGSDQVEGHASVARQESAPTTDVPTIDPSPPSLIGFETALVSGDRAAVLVHDLAQTLLFWLAEPALALQHGRWLLPSALQALNRRLLHPEPEPLPRSHKRTQRLRFLFFLAAAAGFLPDGQEDSPADGPLTPAAWTWFSEPPELRLACLWQAWRDAPPSLRRAYAQPEARLPPPWPGLLLNQLMGQPVPFTARSLADALLGSEAGYTAYFTAHLPDLQTLDTLIGETLAASLYALMVVDQVGQVGRPGETEGTDAPRRSYTLTPLGRRLLASCVLGPTAVGSPPPAATGNRKSVPASPLPFGAPPTESKPSAVATLDVRGRDVWRLSIPVWASPAPQAMLALHATYQELSRQTGAPCHVYRLSEAALATAAAAGHGLAGLLQALQDLGLSLAADQLAQLQVWHARGQEIEIAVLPLLRTASADLLRRLLDHAAARASLGEIIGPTAAILNEPAAQALPRLHAAGFYPRAVDPPTRSARAGSAQESAGRASQTQPALPAALWLAGQLYAALGEHLNLPLPPPFAALQALLGGLPPLQQAALQAQWQALRDRLLALLDGQAFTPPPQPTDPARWRPLIEQAIAAGADLELTYFTAGRNLLTRRTVTPYWIEEHHGIPYLRADCHLVSRVRLFRLDRIQAIAE